MTQAWKMTHEGGYSYVSYDKPTDEHMAHYAKHKVEVEEVTIKGPVVRLFLAITDSGDGSHGVEIFPSAEARDKEYPCGDECFEMGFDVPPEHVEMYLDLSDYEVKT